MINAMIEKVQTDTKELVKDSTQSGEERCCKAEDV